MEEKKIILRSYTSIWKYKKKIYRFEDLKMIIPLALEDLGFFCVGLCIVLLFSKILPVFTTIPFVIRFGLIPFGLMKFLTKKTFDGKKPHRFLIGMLAFFLEPKSLARFQPIHKEKNMTFSYVVMRREKIINIINENINKRKRRKGEDR